tara:strand:- start:1326 stop:1703 length:378 start_codon:yes stop_codon:yes gene_type:complete
MNLNIIEFFMDESKNFLGGVVNKIGSTKFNNMYYRYLDYYELNKSICNFKTVNYIAIALPIFICFVLYIIIIFITKNVFNFYLQEKKEQIVINNKRKFSTYATVDYRKNKIHKKNFNNLNNKLYP